jgi:hypothetical protein
LVGGRKEIAAAHPIDQNTHLNAASACTDQSVDEAATGVVGPEDETRQGDARLCRLDRCDHFRIGLIAIVQDGNSGVAFSAVLCYPVSGPLQRGQMIIAARRRKRRFGRVATWALVAQ